LIALSTAIFTGNSLSLLAVGGVCIAGVFLIKLYYSVITIKEYLDLKKEQDGEELEIPS